MNKTAIGIVILIILAGGGYYVYQNNQAQAPGDMANEQTNDTAQPSAQPAPNPNPTPPAVTPEPQPNPSPVTPPIFSDGEEPDGGGPDVQVVEVIYDGRKFTPSTIDIKVNDYVVFKNNGDSGFWPASAPHPSHTIYPEFDAKKEIAPGGKFTFQFTKEGSWSYHDHLNPSAFGKINVSK